MKINSNTRNVQHEKHSEFYNCLKGPIDKVLNSRPIHLDTLNTYVNVNSSEKSISNFFWQNDKSTALLRGGQGTGKSSTIFFMHKKFLNNKTTSSVYFDLRQHQSKIPSDIWKINDLQDRCDALFPRIRDLISSRFNTVSHSLIDELKLDEYKINWIVFVYIFNHHHQIIPQRLRNINRELLIESRIDKDIASQFSAELSNDFSFQSMFQFIRFAHILYSFYNKKRVSVFIDNIDQMPYAALEAAVSCANGYSSCAAGSRYRDILLGKINFRFIIACRHHNYERLIERVHLNALGANNHYPIAHTGLPDLADIVKKRLSRVQRFGEYNFRKGIRLVKIDTKKCITAYFKQLEDSGTYRQMLLLNNNNLSSTLDTLREITQNKYFPSFDDFVLNYQFGHKSNVSYIVPVNANIAASCLVWGNPEHFHHTIYPTVPTRIPNIFGWNGIDLMSFMLPLRIILILRRFGSSSEDTNMVSTAVLYKRLSQCFPVKSDLFIEAIKFLHRSKSIIFYAEGNSYTINSYSSLRLSYKSEYLLDYATRYDQLCLAYLEDLYIAQQDQLMKLPEIGKSLRFQDDTVKASLIKYCYDLEESQMQVVYNMGLKEKYFSIFPKSPLTEIFTKGVSSNIKDIGKNESILYSESVEKLSLYFDNSFSMSDMVDIALEQASVPLIFQNGVQLLSDSRADSDCNDKIDELYLMLASIRNDIEESKPVETERKQRFFGLLNETVSVGRNSEKIAEWASEFGEFLNTFSAG